MLLPKQIWKDIPGYEGKYQVSNTGRVRSLNYGRTGKIKVLKQGTKDNGYKVVVIYKNGKRKKYLVHRLVAQAFIPNPNNYPIINHKDENKTNNAVWNLEWCTYEYNVNYGNCKQKIKEAKSDNVLYINTQHQTQLKEQLHKIQQIYSNCHHK